MLDWIESLYLIWEICQILRRFSHTNCIYFILKTSSRHFINL